MEPLPLQIAIFKMPLLPLYCRLLARLKMRLAPAYLSQMRWEAGKMQPPEKDLRRAAHRSRTPEGGLRLLRWPGPNREIGAFRCSSKRPCPAWKPACIGSLMARLKWQRVCTCGCSLHEGANSASLLCLALLSFCLMCRTLVPCWKHQAAAAIVLALDCCFEHL